MAYITGETTGYLNLAAILRDFLTTNEDLVADGQEWEQIGGETGALAAGAFMSFRGRGLGGTDEVLLSLTLSENVPSNHYMIGIRGHTAYNEAVPSSTPPGLNSPWVYIPTTSGVLRYWMVANGRRFIMVVKANNRYEVMYGGFILPEHLPSDWSYPLLIGGSSPDSRSSASDAVAHSNFWRAQANGYLFTPEQQWRVLENLTGTGNDGTEAPPDSGRLMAVDWKTNIGPRTLTRTIDNQPWLVRGRLAQYGGSDLAARNFLGSFDGVFFTPAAGAAIESLIEHGGKEYLVVSNVYRNTNGQIAAICLE